MANHVTVLLLCGPGEKFDVDEFNRKKNRNFCAEVMPPPSGMFGVTYGDWLMENWGTAWGTFNNKAYKLGGDLSPIAIEFQCSWLEPRESVMQLIFRKLCADYGFKSIHAIAFDPHDDSTRVVGQYLESEGP